MDVFNVEIGMKVSDLYMQGMTAAQVAKKVAVVMIVGGSYEGMEAYVSTQIVVPPDRHLCLVDNLCVHGAFLEVKELRQRPTICRGVQISVLLDGFWDVGEIVQQVKSVRCADDENSPLALGEVIELEGLPRHSEAGHEGFSLEKLIDYRRLFVVHEMK